jgi:hypothetical protein
MEDYLLSTIENYWLADFLVRLEEGETENLTPRQKMLYESYEDNVELFGMFDRGVGANGAHYVPAEKNPFVSSGMICSNCVFFKGGNVCEIVEGEIEPNAVCKLWIIPENLISGE